jgi:hypothetical protein
VKTSRWRRFAVVAAGAVVLAVGAVAAPVRADTGTTVGYAVFDRVTGTFTAQSNASMRFRSASIVKLLIALDYLWGENGPAPGDPRRPGLDKMLSSSDDGAASDFWLADGERGIVTRMVGRLGLADTAPPPAGYEGTWGYTAISPDDVVRIYRYVLDSAPAGTRDYLMGRLRQSTRCSSDEFDQSFGIRSAFPAPWAIKQGWSGFGGRGDCDGGPAEPATPPTSDGPGLDLVRPALHTTGVVGSGDRSIVAVFTLQPVGTSFGAASTTLTRITRDLPVAGATPYPGPWFGTWASGVKVRATPSISSAVVGVLPAGIEVNVGCEKSGQVVSVDGYTNAWWAYLPERGGYMTNIYVISPGDKLPGVPDCS